MGNRFNRTRVIVIIIMPLPFSPSRFVTKNPRRISRDIDVTILLLLDFSLRVFESSRKGRRSFQVIIATWKSLARNRTLFPPFYSQTFSYRWLGSNQCHYPFILQMIAIFLESLRRIATVYIQKKPLNFTYQERSVFRKKFIILLLLLLERYFFSCSIFEIFNHRCSYSIVGCYWSVRILERFAPAHL